MANGDLLRNVQLPDFRTTQQFPIAETIAAIQRKPVLEEQLKSSKQQRQLEPLRFALQAAQIGSQLATSSVARAQAKEALREKTEKKQELTNLASILTGTLEQQIRPLQQQLRPIQQQLRQATTQIQPTVQIPEARLPSGITPTAQVPGPPVTGPAPQRLPPQQVTQLRQQAAPLQQQVGQLQQRQQVVGSLARQGLVKTALEFSQTPTGGIGQDLALQATRVGIPIKADATLDQLDSGIKLSELQKKLTDKPVTKPTLVKVFNIDTGLVEIEELLPGDSLKPNLKLLEQFKKAPTEVQSKTAGFASAMAASNVTLTSLELLGEQGKIPFDPKDVIDPFNTFLVENANRENIQPLFIGFRRELANPYAQIYFDSMLEFILADTRKKSGAAIKAEEISQSYQTFITFGGDSPAASLAKRQRRRRTVKDNVVEGNAGLRPDRLIVNLKQTTKQSAKDLSSVLNLIKNPNILPAKKRKRLQQLRAKQRR